MLRALCAELRGLDAVSNINGMSNEPGTRLRGRQPGLEACKLMKWLVAFHGPSMPQDYTSGAE